MWHELHARAASYRRGHGIEELLWLDAFSARIPCRACRYHWRRLVKAHPPDLATRHRYFRWTVRAHNEINLLLGHPVFSFLEACVKYTLA